MKIKLFLFSFLLIGFNRGQWCIIQVQEEDITPDSLLKFPIVDGSVRK